MDRSLSLSRGEQRLTSPAPTCSPATPTADWRDGLRTIVAEGPDGKQYHRELTEHEPASSTQDPAAQPRSTPQGHSDVPEPDTAPEAVVESTPNILDIDRSRARDRGETGSHARAQDEGVTVGIEDNDPNEENAR